MIYFISFSDICLLHYKMGNVKSIAVTITESALELFEAGGVVQAKWESH